MTCPVCHGLRFVKDMPCRRCNTKVLSLREKLVRDAYQFYSNGCLVPFHEQGKDMQQLCYDYVDRVLRTVALTLETEETPQK